MYKSNRQRRFFHSPGAKKAGITPAQVHEFDRASKGKQLPEKVKKPKHDGPFRFGKVKFK